jgi:hypothetical protein
MDKKLVQKGSEQPLTKVGLDDERTKSGQANDTKREDIGRFTDEVMEEQSKYHEVVRM